MWFRGISGRGLGNPQSGEKTKSSSLDSSSVNINNKCVDHLRHWQKGRKSLNVSMLQYTEKMENINVSKLPFWPMLCQQHHSHIIKLVLRVSWWSIVCVQHNYLNITLLHHSITWVIPFCFLPGNNAVTNIVEHKSFFLV